VIQGNSLLLLLYLFCSLVVAACTPTARSSQSTHVATAATAAETAAAAESQPADPSQELVCRSETVTGTRFQRRYCATQAERDQRQQDDRESGERMQRKGAQVSIPPTD
jgi:predicted secreted protein